MAHGIEKEELRSDGRLDEHDHAGGDYRKKADDIHDSNYIEDDVAWAGQ